MTEAEHTLIVGLTGGGKTTLAEALTKHCRRIIVLTTKPKAKAFSTGYLEARTSREVLAHVKRNWNSQKGFRVVWRVFAAPGESELPVAALDWVCKCLYGWQQGYADGLDPRQIVLNIDEVQDFFTHAAASKGHAFNWAVSQGRDWGINLMVGTQRPANIHPMFRDNVTNLYSLALAGDTTINRVSECLGGVHKDRIKAVKKFHYAYFREKEFVCSGSTRTPKIGRKLP